MATTTWVITHYNGTTYTEITSRVLSMNLTQGREKYLDNYAGGAIQLTINNASNYAAGIVYGNTILVETEVSGAVRFYTEYWVQEIVYDDYPGGTGLNTATITAVDWISRAGRVQAESLVLAQGTTGSQIAQFQASALGPLPADMLVNGAGGGSSIASATTYTGTVNNYLNLLQTTERGYVALRGTTLIFIGRSVVANYTPGNVTLGRTTSNTQIAYQDFERIQNGSQFINRATITSSGVATQTEVNTTSQSLYGPAFYSSETVDYNATQADGNAAWIVNNFSDPASLRFTCTFTDRAQNQTAYDNYQTEVWFSFNRTINFSYTVPGGSPTTVACVVEGATINVTPQETRWTLSLSPLQYYQFFTLNSSTLGILDTSRLGW